MKIGIIGCGNMGNTLARGILSKKILPFNSIYVSDKDPARVKELYRKFGVRVSENKETVKKSDFVIIAVKPQDGRELLTSIAGELDDSKHLISIMAGVTILNIESLIGKKMAVTRVMSNIALMAGKGISCLSHNRFVKEKVVVHRIFSSVGEVIEIEETHMDIVTALSGSGLAYFFYLAEALRESAIKLGLRKDYAAKLAAATLIGSGALLETMELSPEILIERVKSKGGTTEAALTVFESNKFGKIVEEAMRAATKRAKELSKES